MWIRCESQKYIFDDLLLTFSLKKKTTEKYSTLCPDAAQPCESREKNGWKLCIFADISSFLRAFSICFLLVVIIFNVDMKKWSMLWKLKLHHVCTFHIVKKVRIKLNEQKKYRSLSKYKFSFVSYPVNSDLWRKR